MQLSPRTIVVLKNFSNINPGLVIKPGSIIRTAAEAMDLLAVATIEEKFEKQFAIANLSQFLGVLSTFETPTLKFKDKSLFITEGLREYQYVYGEPAFIKSPPDKEIVLPKTVASFQLSKKVLNDMTRISAISQFPEVAIVGDVDGLYFRGLDCKNSTNNVYNQKLGNDTPGLNFMAVFGADKLNVLLSEDYQVTVTKGIVQFKSIDVSYWIAPIEKYSSYGVK
jgi:hypothetical protein